MSDKKFKSKIIVSIATIIFVLSFSWSKAEEQVVPPSEGSQTQAISDPATPPAGNDNLIQNSDNPNADSAATDNDPAGESKAEAKPAPEGSGSVCGNAIMENDEACDDGNSKDDDGCNSLCMKEDPDNHNILTGIIRNLEISDVSIIAQWQMSDQKENDSYTGDDDSQENGSQFLPTGQFGVSKPIIVCSLVADTGGAENIASVHAVLSYPGDISISKDGTSGCGQKKGELELKRIPDGEAKDLLCEKIRKDNNNLPDWNKSQNDNIAYGFEQACGLEGYLEKRTAAVYCTESNLAFNDPAGDYRVLISARNSGGNTKTKDGIMKYLELTTFETDFSQIQYGPVKESQWKVLSGDLEWGGTKPTIRNSGNTRLMVKAYQNDFGLGKTDGNWNIAYQARVGSVAAFTEYKPEQATLLNDILELGAVSGMDFGANISRFPSEIEKAAFWGNLVLTAEKAPNPVCK
jgi:cysteine-rich repeat protein